MRGLVCISVLALLGAAGCSSGDGDTARPAQNQAGTAGAPTGGTPSLPSGGSTSSTAGGGSAGVSPGGTTTGGSTGQAGSQANGGSGINDTTAHVITWVPPYRVEESKQQLSANFDGVT